MLILTPKTEEELTAKQNDTLDSEILTVRYFNENHYVFQARGSREDPDPETDAPEEEPTYNYWYCSDCGILYEPDDLVLVKYGPLLPPIDSDTDPPARTSQAYCPVTKQVPVLVRDEATGIARQVFQDVVCDEPLETNSPDYWVENFNLTKR